MIIISGLTAFTNFTVYANDEEIVADLHRSFKKIDIKLEQDLEFIKNHNISQQETFILIGMTGAGKSTLLNFLAKNPLKAENNAGQWEIDVIGQPLPGSEIGHNGASQTSEPNYWHDRARRVYFDTPGFADSRDESQNTKNMYAIKRLFESSHSTRVIIPISEPSIQTRVQVLRELVDLLGKMIKPEEVEHFCKSTCLVLTMQADFARTSVVNNVRTKFERILAEPTLNISPQGRHLLGKLKDYAQISFMPKPTQEQNPYLSFSEPEGRSVYDNILADLARTTPVQTITPNLVFSDRATTYSLARLNMLKKEIDEFLNKQLIANIYKGCEAKIRDANQTDIQQLRDYFKNLAVTLDNVQSTNLNNFKQSIRTVLQNNNMSEIYSDLTTKIDSLAFLQLINPTVGFTLNEWVKPFTDARAGIKALAQQPKHRLHTDGTLIFDDLLVGMSDIRKAMDVNIHTIKSIEVYSLNTLLIDADLRLPGQSLILIAPHWQVINTQAAPRNIYLSGNHGAKEADGSYPGGDGQPGHNGQHSGHFWGKGLTLDGLNQLTVKTDGGNGGNGGRGGDGENGKDGVDGLFDKVTSTGSLHNGWMNQHYYNDQGTDGTIGRDGGKGGSGGIKGFKGIRIIDRHSWSDDSKDGQDGQPGAMGVPGIGGLHGKHVKGQAIYFCNEFLSWDVPHEYIDRGRAANGQIPQTLNSNGSQIQTQQPHFPDTDGKMRMYKEFFEEKSVLIPFVKPLS